MNKSESKYFNTAAKMDDALLSLLEEKDFQYVTVMEICKKARVNRSTFYLHYENTVDLLEETLRYSFKKLEEKFEKINIPNIARLDQYSLDELILITPTHLVPYLEFIKENKKIFSATLLQPQAMQANKTFDLLCQKVIHPIMTQFKIDKKEFDYRSVFYVNGISAVIKEWVKNDCVEEIDKIAQIINDCIIPLINRQ